MLCAVVCGVPVFLCALIRRTRAPLSGSSHRSRLAPPTFLQYTVYTGEDKFILKFLRMMITIGDGRIDSVRGRSCMRNWSQSILGNELAFNTAVIESACRWC